MLGLTGWLLLGMLLLPIGGAIIARLLGRRWGQFATRLVAGGAFLGAIGCLLALQHTPLNAAALGRLAIFLPSRDVVVSRDALIELPTAAPSTSPEPTTTTASIPSPVPAEPATAIVQPSLTPTATPTEAPALPTEVPPPPTEAPLPTTAPPPTEVPRPAPRRYLVQAGDTLRSIATQFDISVEVLLRYNGLSPEEGDSLRVGQEIFIPQQ